MMYDPYDIEWTATDPLERRISMYKSVIELREGKHDRPPEYLPIEEVRDIVSNPDRIDISAQKDSRDIYYQYCSDEEYPYARAVVDFSKSKDDGDVVSWSRYRQPVSSHGIRYPKE